MPLGGWILFGVFALGIAGLGLMTAYAVDLSRRGNLITITICVLLITALLIGMLAYYRNTESGKRAMKSWKSELNEGINRTVRVYDMEGDLIQEYSGKFDIDYDDDRIIFDDQDGKRHVIYYPTGTVIIDEVD